MVTAELPAFDEPGTAAEEAAFEARADAIVLEGVTVGEHRALHRKLWRLQGRSGGEILLAERMVERGLMALEDPSVRKVLVRTRIGQHVLKKLCPT